MKKTFQLKNLLVSMAIAGSAALTVAPATVQAGASANVAAASNYMWRGITQTNNAAAVSGGLDYSMDSGLYVGTWASTVDFQSPDSTTGNVTTVGSEYELDFYGGYAGSASDIDYDIGYLYYAYPISDDADFSDVYASVGFMGATLGANVSVSEPKGAKTGDVYVYGSYGIDLSDSLSMGILVGNQSYAEKGQDSYTHGQLSLSVSDFSLAIDKNFEKAYGGVNEDKPVVTISYSKSFDL